MTTRSNWPIKLFFWTIPCLFLFSLFYTVNLKQLIVNKIDHDWIRIADLWYWKDHFTICATTTPQTYRVTSLKTDLNPLTISVTRKKLPNI